VTAARTDGGERNGGEGGNDSGEKKQHWQREKNAGQGSR
jgi:hypothetical protein